MTTIQILLIGLLVLLNAALGLYIANRLRERKILYTVAIRSQILHDYLDVSCYWEKGMTDDQMIGRLMKAIDLKGIAFERVKVEAEEEQEKKRKKFSQKEAVVKT